MIANLKNLVYCLAFAGLLALSSQVAAGQDVSIRNNLAYDAIGTLNAAVEFQVGDHVSVGVNGGFKSWPRFLAWESNNTENTTHWRHFLVSPEARYYFSEVFKGAFIGADALYTHFNVGDVKFPIGLYPEAKDYRFQGDFYGGGLSGGYAWRLGPHWRIEAEAGVELGYVKADKFECAHCGSQVGRKEGAAFIPKVGINLAYNFKRREQKKQEILEIIAPPQPELPELELEPEPEPEIVPELEPLPAILSHPVVRLASEYKPYTPDRVLRKEKGALYVYFPKNSYKLERSFSEGSYSRDNGPTLDEILAVTEEILKDTVTRVSCIQIVGLSSVDGPSDVNRNISLDRANALKRYIQERVPVPDGLFETVGGGEAWTELKDIVKDLLDSVGESDLTREQLQKVLTIMENEPRSDAREQQLRALDGGNVFRILTGSLLKDLRSSGYVRVYVEENNNK